jgi:hypothetical protein
MPSIQADDGGGRATNVPITLPSNSHKDRAKARQERPKREPIVTSQVRERPKGIFGQVVRNLIQEDRHTLAEYVVMDVLLPALKSTITDAVSKGAERLLYGENRPTRPGRAGFYNYGGVSTARAATPTRSADPRPDIGRRTRAVHSFADIIIATRGEAEDVLDALREMIDNYGSASVSDFYDLVDFTAEFTDAKWGWESLADAGVRAVKGGYVLMLPPTVPLTSN